MRFALSPARRLTSHDSVPRYGEGSQHQCSRTHDTLYCLFCTTLWLGQIQSVLKQIQQTNDIDLTCFSHVLENLGERSIPSDHAAVLVVIQKPTIRCDNKAKRIPSWMSEHPVFCSILIRRSCGLQNHS